MGGHTKTKATTPPARSRLLVIVGCHGDATVGHPACPHMRSERTPQSGYAVDYWCHATNPRFMIDGYVEWDSEKRKPGDFPADCPLTDDWGHLIKQAQ